MALSFLFTCCLQMYFADGLQVGDGVIDPTMDWAAYTDSFTGG